MSETNESSAQIESKPTRPEVSKGPEATSGSSRQPAGSRGKAALILSLIAICLSAAFAASAYFIWNEVQQLAGWQGSLGGQVDERLQPLNSSVDSLSRNIDEATRKLDQQIEEIGLRLNSLAEQQQAYDDRLSVLAALMGRSEHGWRLAEIEYLLRIASQRLQLQRDVDTAEMALQSADALLRDLADPHFLKVREQIARELEALRSVPEVDRNGIALTLGALLERIDTLAVAGARYEPKTKEGSAGFDTTATATDWKEVPGLIWAALSELFHLREHDKPLTPMLPPEREYFLRENLRLQLAAARLALLRDDAAQYRTALNASQDWLSRYFSAEDSGVKELITKIEDLLAVNIRPDLPGLSGSLRLLRQQMKLSEQQNVVPVDPDRQTSRTGSGQTEQGVNEASEQ
ncbi:MAG: uroporphyrinogen-III C-methyltransferase [Thiogranum sp.]|nr:uroporphyrinogen-III C-methyltransferase [Thiogranum sp.]